ncbi:MAG TPA: YdeI/OmpD-associated family protein [Chloroflexota bacterium]|jgi:uncharacterized protein YdeI (YjbR/CyaY-like superfamily)
METFANLPVLLCASPREWEDWLNEHHGEQGGVWLKIAKKGVGIGSVSYSDALDSALCHGWIDGQKQSYDNTFWLQKFTPRRPKSLWSRVNTERATVLIESGKMMPGGLREVDAAKADGRWDAAYASQRMMAVPDDFQAELDRFPIAKEFFATLNAANRYAICYRIESAKKPETRRARIDTFIAMLVAKEKLHP